MVRKTLSAMLIFIASSNTIYSMEDPTTLEKRESGITGLSVQSSDIGITHQYVGPLNGLPKVPLIHHYTGFFPPPVPLVIKGKLSNILMSKMIEETGEALKLMNEIGVDPSDPFIIVVQGFSQVTGNKPLLLRPMYFFSENTEYSKDSYYIENIKLKAGIFGINPEGLSVTPDKPQTPYDFTVSIHNNKNNPREKPELVSSPNKMQVIGLTDTTIPAAFYGFYKSSSHGNKGVSVLHIILPDAEIQKFQAELDKLGASPSIGQVANKISEMVGTTENDNIQAILYLLKNTIENMSF